MNTALWIIQALLGEMIFLLSIIKMFLPEQKLNKLGVGGRHPVTLIRFIGVSELLIGAGLILPWLTGILPMLTWLAAADLCTIMLLAINEHVKYNEPRKILMNVIIICLAVSVVVGRFIPLG